MTDKGNRPLTWEAPVVEIAGEEYTMRRLGIIDTLRLAQIVTAGMAGLGQELHNVDTMDPAILALVLVAGATYAEKQTLTFLGGCIGLEGDELRDENRFPMGSELAIIEKLVEHEDVLAFFDRLRGLVKHPALAKLKRPLSQTSSTSSSTATGGQTTKSSASPTPGSSSSSGSQQKRGQGKRRKS